MDGNRFDSLSRLVATTASRRALLGLATALGFSPLLADARKRRKKKRCKRSKKCGSGCCGAGRCFAKAVDPDDSSVLSYGCCPANKICQPPPDKDLPDQCCYPDEHCQPELADNPDFDSLCCRPCGVGVCCKVFEECINGLCNSEDVQTARLPRTRRR